MTVSQAPFAAPFATTWTQADSQRLYDLEVEAPDSQVDPSGFDAWRKRFWPVMEELQRAVAGHILHLAETTGLSQPPHAEAAQTPWLSLWRKASAQEALEGYEFERLGHMFYMALARNFGAVRRPRAGEEAPEAATLHRTLVELIEAGNFSSFETEREECLLSGSSLSLELKGWAPSFRIFKPEFRRFDALAEGDIVAPGLEHVTIRVPTGHLLVADWFRHAAFTSQTDKVLEGNPSINNEAGCVERTRRMAEQLSVASVFVGNTSPEIVAHQGGLRMGYLGDEDEGAGGLEGSSMGSICTDLWWATIVDKQVLVDILAQTLPRPEAVAEVDKLIREQASDIREVQVEPGEYHLYFAGSPETFAQHFWMEEVGFQGFEEPMLALHPTSLTPVLKKASIPSP